MSQPFQDHLKQAREWGFTDNLDPAPLARLMTYATERDYELPKEEKKRWRKLGVLDVQGRIYANKDEVQNGIFWILLGLVWHGMVKKA